MANSLITTLNEKRRWAQTTILLTPSQLWERGLNEHHNGLIRQYRPKGMELDKVTAEKSPCSRISQTTDLEYCLAIKRPMKFTMKCI